MADDHPAVLSRAVLETLAYADIFDSPLTLPEIERYLSGVPATRAAIERVLYRERFASRRGDYVTLAGREDLLTLRLEREIHSKALLPRAIRYGRALGALPFVRMVALTGSLAVLNPARGADLDYLLVTERGRLWTARAFAVSFGRLMRPFGLRICVNLLISEDALHWPHHDLYSAREICQMIPIIGPDVYRRFRVANSWTDSLLPNARLLPPTLVEIPVSPAADWPQRTLEHSLRGVLGAKLEQWVMRYQLNTIARRPGSRAETEFGPDICQANFHEHRRWTQEALEERVRKLHIRVLGIPEPVPQP